MTETKLKKLTIKQLTAKFWELSRSRQEAFLKELHTISPQNKDFFQIWLGKNNATVVASLKKDIEKETIQRIPRYRKLRLSKLNEILRNGEKYSLSMLEQIDLKNEVWRGMITFIINKKWLPERYEIACARHIEQYIQMVQHHVLETSEQNDILLKTKQDLHKIITLHPQIFYIQSLYTKHFE